MALQTITKEQQQMATRALHQAYAGGIIKSPRFYPDAFSWKPPTIPDSVIKALDRMPYPPPKRSDRLIDQLDEPARDTRAQIYQDVSYFHDAPAQESFVDGNSYELARFITADETGFVKLCWTYAEILPAGGPPPPFIDCPWQDPFFVDRNLPGLTVTWFLRLDQGVFQKHWPAPYVGPTTGVTGNGFSPLNEWADYRFMWGRTQVNVFWLVPQRHALRLYARIEGDNDDLRVLGGRLEGYTQRVDVKATGFNVSHGW